MWEALSERLLILDSAGEGGPETAPSM